MSYVSLHSIITIFGVFFYISIFLSLMHLDSAISIYALFKFPLFYYFGQIFLLLSVFLN